MQRKTEKGQKHSVCWNNNKVCLNSPCLSPWLPVKLPMMPPASPRPAMSLLWLSVEMKVPRDGKGCLAPRPRPYHTKTQWWRRVERRFFCMHTQQTNYLLLCFIFLNRPEVSNASVCNSIINVTLRETWRIKVEMPALVRDYRTWLQLHTQTFYSKTLWKTSSVYFPRSNHIQTKTELWSPLKPDTTSISSPFFYLF